MTIISLTVSHSQNLVIQTTMRTYRYRLNWIQNQGERLLLQDILLLQEAKTIKFQELWTLATHVLRPVH